MGNVVEKFKTVKQVAEDNGCGVRAVQNWCLTNDVPYIGNGQRKQYMIYPEHENKFKTREKPGRRWTPKKTRKKNK